MLVELQKVLAALKEARERVGEVTDAKPGDETHDGNMTECDGDGPVATRKAQLHELVRHVSKH